MAVLYLPANAGVQTLVLDGCWIAALDGGPMGELLWPMGQSCCGRAGAGAAPRWLDQGLLVGIGLDLECWK